MSTRRRIILHWTAGLSYPNAEELKHYHYLVDADGGVHEGLCSPEDNDNCYDGRYAAHTGGGNTRSIGVAVCGMFGFISKTCPGDYPLTRVQIERMFSLCAELLHDKGHLSVTRENLMTHYEFGISNPNTSSKGKIDIIHLPPYPGIKREDIGNFIRNKVKWYYSRRIRKLKENKIL